MFIFEFANRNPLTSDTKIFLPQNVDLKPLVFGDFRQRAECGNVPNKNPEIFWGLSGADPGLDGVGAAFEGLVKINDGAKLSRAKYSWHFCLRAIENFWGFSAQICVLPFSKYFFLLFLILNSKTIDANNTLHFDKFVIYLSLISGFWEQLKV